MTATQTETKDEAYTAPYSIQALNSPDSPTGTADNIHEALEMAWRLNRHTETPTTITDHRDGAPRVIAKLTLEWIDES